MNNWRRIINVSPSSSGICKRNQSKKFSLQCHFVNPWDWNLFQTPTGCWYEKISWYLAHERGRVERAGWTFVGCRQNYSRAADGLEMGMPRFVSNFVNFLVLKMCTESVLVPEPLWKISAQSPANKKKQNQSPLLKLCKKLWRKLVSDRAVFILIWCKLLVQQFRKKCFQISYHKLHKCVRFLLFKW